MVVDQIPKNANQQSLQARAVTNLAKRKNLGLDGCSPMQDSAILSPQHSASLNFSIPVRCLYHEQAKSIVAIQVRIFMLILTNTFLYFQ